MAIGLRLLHSYYSDEGNDLSWAVWSDLGADPGTDAPVRSGDVFLGEVWESEEVGDVIIETRTYTNMMKTAVFSNGFYTLARKTVIELGYNTVTYESLDDVVRWHLLIYRTDVATGATSEVFSIEVENPEFQDGSPAIWYARSLATGCDADGKNFDAIVVPDTLKETEAVRIRSSDGESFVATPFKLPLVSISDDARFALCGGAPLLIAPAGDGVTVIKGTHDEGISWFDIVSVAYFPDIQDSCFSEVETIHLDEFFSWYEEGNYRTRTESKILDLKTLTLSPGLELVTVGVYRFGSVIRDSNDEYTATWEGGSAPILYDVYLINDYPTIIANVSLPPGDLSVFSKNGPVLIPWIPFSAVLEAAPEVRPLFWVNLVGAREIP